MEIKPLPRKAVRPAFKHGLNKNYSIASIQKIISETNAGIQYVDLHIGGTEPAVTGLLGEKSLDPR